MKKHIPNTITSLNLIFGVIAIFMATSGRIEIAAIFILFAAVMDFLDGLVARWLNAFSEVGKQLDSLADLISFGLAPAAIVKIILDSSGMQLVLWEENLLPWIVLIMPLFAALRLAKFNVDDSQEKSFSGLPVPANALFFAGWVLAANYYSDEHGVNGWLADQIFNGYLLAALVVFFAVLMVVPMRLFSLKMEGLGIDRNAIRYVFIVLCVIMFVLFGLMALPLCIVLYLLVANITKVLRND